MRTIVAFVLLALPSLASAQETPPPAEPPVVRVDLDLPSIGIGAGTLDREPGLVATFGARVAARTGDGAFGAFSYHDGDPDAQLFGPRDPRAEAWLVDVGYLRRLRLAGDDRLGLGLDLLGGFTIGEVRFRQGSNGFCFGGCPTPPTEPESVADGIHVGANAGASLDLRAWGFLVGLDVRYRMLFATGPITNGERLDQHVVQVGLHVGFGIY